MKDATPADKKDILIAALEERYEAMRVIRERVQGVGIWALGLMVAGAAWLIQKEEALTLQQELLFLVLLGISLWAVRAKYLADLERGFVSQQRVAVRLEQALSLYTPGVFDDAAEPVYPRQWEKAGGKDGPGRFFASTYLLLYVGAGALAFTIMLLAGNFRALFRLLVCW